MDWKKQYVEEKGYSSFNKYNENDYTKFLENKLTELEQTLQLLQPDVIGSLPIVYVNQGDSTHGKDSNGKEYFIKHVGNDL